MLTWRECALDQLRIKWLERGGKKTRSALKTEENSCTLLRGLYDKSMLPVNPAVIF